MKILVLSSGMSVHTHRFLEWLGAMGHTSLLADHTPLENPIQRTRFLPYPGAPKLPKRLNRLARLFRVIQLKRLAETFQPDLVHVHYVDGRAIDCMEAGLHPLVLSCWGTDINAWFDKSPSPRARQRIGAALRSAQHVFADTPFLLERAAQLAGKPLPTSLLYFGIDTQLFKPENQAPRAEIRRRYAIPLGAKALLSVRLWNPLYNHRLILEAFAQALPGLPEPACLLFKAAYLSQSPELTEELKSLAERLGLARQIIWLPALAYNAMPGLYAACDAVVSYPNRDGMPVSFFEAAAAGKPVISSDLPPYQGVGLEEFFDFVPTNDPTRLAEKMAAVLSRSPAEQAARSQASQAWAWRCADQSRSMAHLAEVYQGLAASKSPL